MSESTSQVDHQISPVHLLDTAKHHLAHAIRHLDRLCEPCAPQDVAFNSEHAAKHATEALDHLQRGFEKLAEHDSTASEFAAEHDRLTAARSEVREGARKGMSNFIKSLPRKTVV